MLKGETEVYHFTQQLLHEVSYQLNTFDERKALHTATAETLAMLDAVGDNHVLAHHWGASTDNPTCAHSLCR